MIKSGGKSGCKSMIKSGCKSMKSLRNKMLELQQLCHSIVYNDNKNTHLYGTLINFTSHPTNSHIWEVKDRILGKINEKRFR